MAKFRKLPAVIEAVQWNGEAGTANRFIGERYGVDWEYEDAGVSTLIIPTLEGKMRCQVSDWIIRGVKGELYACRDDIFQATYEPVEETL